jgi:hypothetical protein
MDVTIEFDNAMCETCETLIAGTYTLQRVEGEICRWQLILRKTDTGWYEVCNDDYAGYGDEITLIAISVDVRCVKNEYTINAGFTIARQYATGTEIGGFTGVVYDTRNARHSTGSYYFAVVPVSEWECNAGNTATLQWQYTLLASDLEIYYPSPYNVWLGARGSKTIIGSPGPPIPPQNIPFGGGLFGVQYLMISPVCQPPVTITVTGVP